MDQNCKGILPVVHIEVYILKYIGLKLFKLPL